MYYMTAVQLHMKINVYESKRNGTITLVHESSSLLFAIITTDDVDE